MTLNLQTIMAELVPTILKAGAVVMEVYETDFEVYGKADASPVTEADRRGEEVIAADLARIAPSIPMVGEEAKSEGQCPDISGGTFWLVDPLDGTKEFIKKGGDFTVNIGLIVDNKPVLGLVYAPASNTLYAGIVGEGAWSATIEDGAVTDKHAIACRAANADNLTIVASKSHRSPELEAWLAHFPSANNVSIGSSLKLCLLATGEADIYPRLGPTCEWDTAAAHAVLLAAGGKVLTPEGTPLEYGKDTTTFLNPWFLCIADDTLDVPPLTA
ncbi:3'(2'),5'-bisphosphate nucleotidase CysQ [Kordiimonas sediminis]|uniref:3'(2'),5'-bisphosphate nucleotidase CysQ n=1 Tax=Kordiimonas sediminis TaxID=1735581 RepID=A0A919ATL2_9PROT|nr:3'(2'),5'-bisphosphate nucleotidase CysQ [Kordiimonas sediminis]GHF22477.1 3'(2'),5'-bisphosphate nucleotidase CysQ [Kordiimonas sediminis]